MSNQELCRLMALLQNTRTHLIDVNHKQVALAQQTLASAIDLVRNTKDN